MNIDNEKSHTAVPKRIEIEFTNKCNSLCNFCPRKYVTDIEHGYMNQHLFEKIIDEYPGTIEARWGEAEVLRRQHRIDQSQALLNEVINSNPEFLPAYISLAYIKYIKMDFEQSVKLAL